MLTSSNYWLEVDQITNNFNPSKAAYGYLFSVLPEVKEAMICKYTWDPRKEHWRYGNVEYKGNHLVKHYAVTKRMFQRRLWKKIKDLDLDPKEFM